MSDSDIKLEAGLDISASKKKVKEDVKKLGKINIPLVGKLNMQKTRQEIKQQLSGKNLGTVNLNAKVQSKNITSSVNQVVSQTQKNLNSKPLTFSINKEKLVNDIKIVGQQNSRLFKDVGMTSKYNQLLDSAKLATNNKEIRVLRKSLSAFRSELKATGNAGLNMGDTLKKGLTKATELFGSYGLIMMFSRQLKSAWTEARELDERMVSLSKVSDELSNRNSFPNYLEKTIKAAKELKTSVSDLLYATTEFKKQGNTLEESEILAKQAIVLQNVADVDVDTAISSIKTSMASFDEIGGYTDKQYNEKVTAYSDLVNNLSNKFSIDAEGLVNAIRISAGTLTEANTSIEEVASIITSANRYYNDPDYIANTIKIGSLRMRASKTSSEANELQNLGEDIDGLATSTSKLREEMLDLTGVDIMLDDTNFKSYYQQLYEIAQVYSELDETTQANVLEKMFGKNRSAAGASILKAMASDTVSVYNEAINSAGSSQEEFSRWLEGSEAACNEFRLAMTETYNNVLNGDMVKGLANTGTAILDFANKFGLVESTLRGLLAIGLLKGIGTLTTAIKGSVVQVTNLGSAFNNVKNLSSLTRGTKQYTDAMNLLKQSCVGLTDSQLKQVLSNKALEHSERVKILQYQGLTKKQAEAKLAQLGFIQTTNQQTTANTMATTSTLTLKNAITGLGASIKASLLSNPIGWAIMAISTAISLTTSAISKHNEKLEEQKQKTQEVADEANTLGDEVSELATKYIQLSEAVDTDSSAKDDLLETQTELLKKLGLEGESIDTLIEKYGSLSNAIKQVSIDSLKNAQLDLISNMDVAEEDLLDIGKDGRNGNNVISATGDGAVKAFKVLEGAGIVDEHSIGTEGGVLTLTDNDKTTKGILKNYKKLENALEALRDSSEFDSEELSGNPVYKAIYGRYNEMKTYVDKYKSAIAELNENLSQQYMLTALQERELPKTEEEFEAFKKNLIETAIASKDFVGTDKEIENAVSTYLSTVSEFSQFYTEAKTALNEPITRSGMISKLNNLSEGFEELDKIYASILDKDAFDFKLLDDEKFKETFSSLDNYADFVETVTSNPNDINACKDAFSALVTEWITSVKVLDNVTEDNEKLTAAMLKQMGVANADEVAHYALEKAKAKEHIETSDNIDVTDASTDALIEEATAAGINTNAFLEMVAKEIMFNNTELSTKDKCEKILDIAKACGVASTSMEALKSQIDDWASKNIGSGTRTKTAKEAGLTVKGRKDRGVDEYKAHGNLYIASDGKEFEDYKEAMYYQESLNNIDKINSAFEYNTLKYTGGSTSQDKEKSVENSKEYFDWIERAVKKVQRTITNLGKTVSATFKTWTTRNTALAQEIAEVNNELSLQQQAYERYMAQAESVGLSSYYKNQIQDGSLNIESISDETLKKQIKDYQEYYEKALSASDAVQDLQDQLAELSKTKFQSKITEYEKQLKEIEDYKSTLESVRDLLETQGYIESHNIYNALIELEYDNIQNLQEEYNALQKSLDYAMSNGVEKYSDDWYDMCSQINEVNEQIIEANKNLAEMSNQLREIDWALFDRKQSNISKVTEESDWLIDLLSNKSLHDEETGLITEQGNATLGLHAINYNAYMSQADDYAEELLKINEQIANNPYDTNLLERRDELLESQRDLIDAAEDEKKAMQDLVKDGYDNYLDALKEMIDKRNDAISQIKDLYDYEKNISELNKDITILEKQEIAFRGNDSEEGRAKWQEIQSALEEARQNLEETEYEKYIDDQQKMLDNLYDDAEQWVNERLDNQNELIQQIIDDANNNASDIKATLEKEVREVGGTLSENMMNILSPDSNVGQIVSMYGDNFNTYANTTVNTLLGIKAGIDAMLDDSGIRANTNINALNLTNPYATSGSNSSSGGTSSETTGNTSSNGSGSSSNGWGSWFIDKKNSVAKSKLHIDTSIVDRLKYFDFDSSENARAKYYKSMGGSGEYYGTSKQNRWMIQQMKNNGFKQGGVIGRAIRNSGEDGLILARTGEEVLSLEKIAKLKETLDLANPLAETMARMQIKIPDIQPRNSVVNQEFHMNFELHDVTNGEKLLDFVKNDKRFIKTIQQETIGAMMGQNSMARYKY